MNEEKNLYFLTTKIKKSMNLNLNKNRICIIFHYSPLC